MRKKENTPATIEAEEILLQQLENLFDRPSLVSVADEGGDRGQEQSRMSQKASQSSSQQNAVQFKLVNEKDFQNTFLITNPTSIFKVFTLNQFINLNEQSQLILLERLEDIINKNPNNIHILTDHLSILNVRRMNQKVLDGLGSQEAASQVDSQETDFLLLCLQICFKLPKGHALAKASLLKLIARICHLKCFSKFHVEFVCQTLKKKCPRSCEKQNAQRAMEYLETGTKILEGMYGQRFDSGPTNYFYFSGFLSGIQVNTKNCPYWPFQKGFSAVIWFSISDWSLQDSKNLPVLFNCYSQGYGGFECYFNARKLYYRILHKTYTLPTDESNGILIGERDFQFEARRWYFLAIEHDKPYLARPQLTAYLNDKHVVKFLPIDYPKFEKNARLTLLSVCKNYVGQMSSFALFREQINNNKKFAQLFQNYQEHGITTNQQLKFLNQDIFDSKTSQKMFLLYCPDRTHNKSVFDCVDQNDGELMINSGVFQQGPRHKVAFTGGLESLLPILEYIQIVAAGAEGNLQNLPGMVNNFLKVVNSAIISMQQSKDEFGIKDFSRAVSDQEFKDYEEIKMVQGEQPRPSYTASFFEQEQANFFKALFLLLSKLDKEAVTTQTIQLLAEIRFQLGENELQLQFFKYLLFSSDFWISTQNLEVINEYWSFVKAVYCQNPVQYNKAFSIQNLVDLMLKVSDIKDGHCCEYHMNNSSMIYQPHTQKLIQFEGGTTAGTGKEQKRPSYTPNLKQQTKLPVLENFSMKQKAASEVVPKIYNIDRHLTPIAGVLEGVLTSGGNEILDQIQYIAQSLTVKSSPCFQIQMLKLLKVLLLDSKEDRYCASPIEFAAHFLEAKGLQILLYLCSNSTFDVKSMCIKLIDVLSSQSSLIKIRIDTDLITYMCNIIMPKQVDGSSFIGKAAGPKLSMSEIESGTPLNANQYDVFEQQEDLKQESFDERNASNMDDDMYSSVVHTDAQLSSDLVQFSNDQPSQRATEKKVVEFSSQNYKTEGQKPKKFGTGLFLDEDDSNEENTGREKDLDSDVQVLAPPMAKKYQKGKKKSFGGEEDQPAFDLQIEGSSKGRQTEKVSSNKQAKDFEDMDSGYDKSVKPPLPGPRNKKAPVLAFDFEEPESRQEGKFNQTSSHLLASIGQAIQETEEEAYSDNDDFELDSKKFLKTQKIPSIKGSKQKGLELNIPEDESKPQSKGKFGQKKQIMFAEMEDDDGDKEEEMLLQSKGGKSKFANENVMSKSNLRKPKNFSFGFPDEEEDDEEEGSNQEEEKEQLKSQDTYNDDEEVQMREEIKMNEAKKSSRPKILLMQKEFQTQKPKQREFKKGLDLDMDLEEDKEETLIEAPSKFKKSAEGSQKEQTSFKKTAKTFNSTNLKLNIDTDAINELYTYGGEKGEVKMTEDQELENFEKEIDDLATLCLAAMKRQSPSEPIETQRETFEQKFCTNDESKSGGTQGGQGQQKNPRKQFMTPQSVRGIKKIEFQSKQKKGIGAAANRTGTFSNQTIHEENSPASSSKNDLNFGGTNSGQLQFTQSDIQSQQEQSMDKQFSKDFGKIMKAYKDQKEDTSSYPGESNTTQINLENSQVMMNEQNVNEHLLTSQREAFEQYDKNFGMDDYTQELENLYTSCLEWILNRAPSSLYTTLVVDDFDKICFAPALSLLMTLVTSSNNLLRQKALQDLHMLAKWDSYNGTRILFHPQFHSWILELLMPYQDLSSSYSNLSGPSLAVYDMGCKLHTLLLKNSFLNPEEEAHKKLNYLARWPQIIVQMKKDEFGKSRLIKDFDIANKLSRILMTNLLQSIKDDIQKQRPSLSEENPIWQNIIHSTFMIEEMVLGSSNKGMSTEEWHIEQRDVNSSLLKWVQKDILLYYTGTNDKTLWAEWDLLEALFQILDTLYYPPLKQGAGAVTYNSQLFQSVEEVVFTQLEKVSGEDCSQEVEILLFQGKPAKFSQNQAVLEEGQGEKDKQKPVKRKNILTLAASAFKGQTHQTQTQQQEKQTPTAQEVSFMNSILNLLCLALTQADTKPLTQQWLDRIEKFIKYLMIISETWKTRHIKQYNSVQKKFQDTITYALTFLFHEIHSSSKYSPSNASFQPFSQTLNQLNTPSPKELNFGKIYAQSLKNIMVYFINVIEYSKIRYTPSQLESNLHLTACRGIIQNILVKSYSGQIENLIQFKDISKYKTVDYDDFPECFYLEDWKVTFFYNEQIKAIIKKQLSIKTIEQYIQKRKSYAAHQIEIQNKTEKTKQEILQKMQTDTYEVISSLREFEFERKNKVALINDNLNRERKHSWKVIKKQLLLQRGVWENLVMPFKYEIQIASSDGLKGLLLDKQSNRLKYIQNEQVEKKIFKEVITTGFSFPFNKQTDQASIQKKKEKPEGFLILKAGQSDEENQDESDEEEEDEPVQYQDPLAAIQNAKVVTNFFNKDLSTREKQQLKKKFSPYLKDYLLQTRTKCKEILSEMKCQLLKPFYQRPGLVFLTTSEVIFFDELYIPPDEEPEYDSIFFFRYVKRDDSLLYKFIPLNDIKEIQKRRFLGRKSALEFFLMDNSSILLNFANGDDRDQFSKKIIRQRNQKCCNLKYYDTMEPRRILKKRELTEKWLQWKISNFEYLMALNMLAGRSYSDLSQYPVFPWILVDFENEVDKDIAFGQNPPPGLVPNGFRDLTKNLQLLGSHERQEALRSKYEDPDNHQNKFHCGSHYSNPGIVLHYLCRMQPYLDAFVELNGKNLDKPDRAFYSLQNSIQSSLTDQSDVRELIPEFYFCPEMYMNANLINFGKRQDDEEVNHVELPNWAMENPYYFVMNLREMFESQYVSMNLGSWIDYIFGCKQRDQEAEKALNTFSPLCYEDGIEIEAIEDEVTKRSVQSQIYNFGQTPSQMFQKNQKHPNKQPRNQVVKYNLIVDPQAKLKVYKPVNQAATQQQKGQSQVQKIVIQNEAFLKARFFDDQTIVGITKEGIMTYYIWLSRAHELNPTTPFTCCEDRKKKFDSRVKFGGVELQDRSIRKFDFPLLILMNAKYILRGGFWDGKLLASPYEGKIDQVLSFPGHSSTITVIQCCSSEKTIITGSKRGEIIFWNNLLSQVTDPILSVQNILYHHESQVSSIFLNEDQNLMLTSSFDGTANLYDFWNARLLRTFKYPHLCSINQAVITTCPLQAVCLYSREEHSWAVFSINGESLQSLVEQAKEESRHIISPQVVKDSYFMDKLIYGNERGFVIIRQLPLMRIIRKLQVSNNFPVLSLFFSQEKKFLLVGCGDGGLNVITEPNQGGIQGKSQNATLLQTTTPQ